MTRKIFHSIVLVAAAAMLSALVIITGCLYEYFGSLQENHMQDELELASVAVEEQGKDYLQKISTDRFRLTWVAGDGSVLYDTVTDAESLENHAQRSEVQQALTEGRGQSTRYSSTLLEKTMYYAKRLSDGSVLRISASRSTVGVLLLGLLQPALLVLVLALLLSAFLARRLSKSIVEPLNVLDLEHPEENDTYEELAPLLGRLNRQRRQIAQQLQQLQKKTDEFQQITANLQEGLVLLDPQGIVLSINLAARRIFSAEENCLGRDFLTVDRSHELSLALSEAMEQGHRELHIQRGGRLYQVDISRIQSQGEGMGAVLLAFDVTEQERAQQSRREFTANVSHELKTPLQGIIGSAELIENGMVKPEDMSRFVGHIRTEAQRLMNLIADIIRLSQLDEGAELPREPVDLLSVAREVVRDLGPAAEKKQLELRLEGENVSFSGVRRLLYEIVYNLCDNAIQYNVEGGSVSLTVAAREGEAQLTVADTGIGIAPEQQDRIFERFYRVDKSHSKASGGTGLGLSIVKHAVQYHGGRIDLKSSLGQGTRITVSFPLTQKELPAAEP